MFPRLMFILVGLFWLTMNFLLWRSEFGGRNQLAGSVPAEKVWEKVLTAPDNSSLNIYYHHKKIGYCTWQSSLGEEQATGKISSDEVRPDGMVSQFSNYSLELEGNAYISALTNNVRFNLSLKLSTNQVWQEFSAHASVRPTAWAVSASAADQKMRLLVDDEEGRWEKSFKFADLQKPEFLMNEFGGGPLAWALMSGLGPQLGRTNNMPNFALGLKWEAHNDWMRFGHSKVRVYRLEAKILDRYKIFIFVSRVGEILWVHLPDELVLSNDAFTHF